MMTNRRTLLLGAAACGLSGAAFAAPKQRTQSDVNEARYANSPWRRLSDEQWRARLSDQAYDVLRREGTERAGTSPLEHEKRDGTYVCAGCALPLFRASDKYDSGTGWPSFMRSLPGALGTKQDFAIGYSRTEYHCARCLGHQGHVFDDGPPPTGLRYCNNGVALRFIPAT
jgi:peptide-methionine (R)-S-oxide reductase